jgi:hypothetical protein
VHIQNTARDKFVSKPCTDTATLLLLIMKFVLLAASFVLIPFTQAEIQQDSFEQNNFIRRKSPNFSSPYNNTRNCSNSSLYDSQSQNSPDYPYDFSDRELNHFRKPFYSQAFKFEPKPAENMPSVDVSPMTSNGANISIKEFGGTSEQFWALGKGGNLYILSKNDKNPSWRKAADERDSFSITGSDHMNQPVMTLIYNRHAFLSRLNKTQDGWDKTQISKNPLSFINSSDKYALGIYQGSLYYYPEHVTSGKLAKWHEIPPPQGYAYTDVSLGSSCAIARLHSKENPAEIKFVKFDMKNMKEGETMRAPVDFPTPVSFYSIALCPSNEKLVAAVTKDSGYLYLSKDAGKTYFLMEQTIKVYRRAVIIDSNTVAAIDRNGLVRVFDASVTLRDPLVISLQEDKQLDDFKVSRNSSKISKYAKKQGDIPMIKYRKDEKNDFSFFNGEHQNIRSLPQSLDGNSEFQFNQNDIYGLPEEYNTTSSLKKIEGLFPQKQVEKYYYPASQANSKVSSERTSQKLSNQTPKDDSSAHSNGKVQKNDMKAKENEKQKNPHITHSLKNANNLKDAKKKQARTPTVYKAFLANVNESMPDYHAILGVSPSSSKKEIEAAYKKLKSQMNLSDIPDHSECQKGNLWLEKSYSSLMQAPSAIL